MDPRPWHRAYDPGVLPTLDYEELTLTDALRRAGRRWPDAPAVVLSGHVTRYARLLVQVEALAAHLRAAGLQPGERVAVHMPNLPQTVVAFHGILAAGGSAGMTNPPYSDHEIVSPWHGAG